MKTVLKNQKTVSAIVALILAGVVTFMAAINSYGVTSNEAELGLKFDETALMERAIADLQEEDYEWVEDDILNDDLQTIKIFNADNELIETVKVSADEAVADEGTQRLLNQAEFLSEYNNTLVYKISE